LPATRGLDKKVVLERHSVWLRRLPVDLRVQAIVPVHDDAGKAVTVTIRKVVVAAKVHPWGLERSQRPKREKEAHSEQESAAQKHAMFVLAADLAGRCAIQRVLLLHRMVQDLGVGEAVG
jgi:hypothetical protein